MALNRSSPGGAVGASSSSSSNLKSKLIMSIELMKLALSGLGRTMDACVDSAATSPDGGFADGEIATTAPVETDRRVNFGSTECGVFSNGGDCCAVIMEFSKLSPGVWKISSSQCSSGAISFALLRFVRDEGAATWGNSRGLLSNCFVDEETEETDREVVDRVVRIGGGGASSSEYF